MSLRQLLLTAFSILVIGACLAVPFIPLTAQPFDATTSGGTAPAMEVLPSSLDVPLPPGLRAGDKIYLADMSPTTRSFFMVGGSNPPRGTVVDLPVRDPDGSTHHVQAAFVPVAFLNGNALNMATEVAGYLLTLLTAALGLLLLWRGQSQAAFGVALWCFAFFLQSMLAIIPLPAPYGNMLNWAGSTLDTLGTVIGLYLVADGLTMSARTAERRRGSYLRFTAVVVLYAVGVAIFNIHFYLHGDFMLFGTEVFGLYGVVSLHFAAFMIPLFILGFAYRRCDPVNQARIRWVLFSLVGLLLSYVLGLTAGRLDLPIFVLNLIATVLVASAFVGFAYAVLKHQLVSLQLVLNRALVYGLITSLVVGVFAAMLSFLEHAALNSETNKLAVMLVVLLLGMGLDTLKKQVNAYIGKAFFRKRQQAEAELTQFARTAPYVEDPEKLLDLAMDALYRNSGAQGVALYFTQKGKMGPKLARQKGDLAFPAKLDNDDLALLRLKAGDAEVNLHDTFSDLEQEGFVYGLTVRGEVMGFVVLGPRPSDAYSLEERRLFGLVAHQVAVAMHGLRLQEQQSLLRDLAEGVFKSLPKAKAKARELVGAV